MRFAAYTASLRMWLSYQSEKRSLFCVEDVDFVTSCLLEKMCTELLYEFRKYRLKLLCKVCWLAAWLMTIVVIFMLTFDFSPSTRVVSYAEATAY